MFAALPFSTFAQEAKSLLPAFGTDGKEFTTKAQNENTTKGWLPTDWTDNSEWAAVSATYTKLTDAPAKGVGAVRIKVEKVDEGQLQLTTYQGTQNFKKGGKYVLTGWVRSPDRINVNVGIRQKGEPYEFYHEQEISTETEWKRFEFAFSPSMDIEAFTMFVVRETGSVDLAGVVLQEKS
jgi:hypothetical protein